MEAGAAASVDVGAVVAPGRAAASAARSSSAGKLQHATPPGCTRGSDACNALNAAARATPTGARMPAPCSTAMARGSTSPCTARPVPTAAPSAESSSACSAVPGAHCAASTHAERRARCSRPRRARLSSSEPTSRRACTALRAAHCTPTGAGRPPPVAATPVAATPLPPTLPPTHSYSFGRSRLRAPVPPSCAAAAREGSCPVKSRRAWLTSASPTAPTTHGPKAFKST